MIFKFSNYEIYSIILIFFLYLICYFKLNKISKFINLYDHPDGVRKLHKSKTPLVGGIFIFSAILLYLIIIPYFLDSGFRYFYLYSYKSVILFYLSFVLIFMLGFLDDKYSISPDKKLIILFGICYLYVISDNTVRINDVRVNFLNLTLEIDKFSPIFTSIFIVTFLILSNMFDGINGQSSIFFIFTLIILGIFNPFIINYLIFIILLLLVFLFFNIRSKIFLGDNGIYALSFIISVLYLKTYNVYGNLVFDQLILISLIPLIDMVRVSISRIFKGKNPMIPDMRHIHHLLNNVRGKLTILMLITILPITLYYFLDNFIISFIIPILIYIYLIFKKSKNEILH